MKIKVMIIDPPSGWQYGFPKIIPYELEDTKKWLVENGYPQEEIDAYGKHFHCHHWEQIIDADFIEKKEVETDD